jgi:hypothetical protein
MTALSDIRKRLGTMPPPEKGKRRFVIVGESAMRALRCEVVGYDKPKALMGKAESDRYPIVETDDFKGWEVVDRPVADLKGGGKWPLER